MGGGGAVIEGGSRDGGRGAGEMAVIEVEGGG